MMSAVQDRTIAVAEIGGTSVKIGFAQSGKVSDYSRTFPTERLRRSPPIAELAAMLNQAFREADIVPDRVVATVPGFLAQDRDLVIHAANIPELNKLKLASLLSAQLGIDVTLERDTVLQLLGESHAGAVIGEYDILAIYFGTGIGAAYLGRQGIFRGFGWALEIGHMPVYLPDLSAEPLRVEAVASGKALSALAERHGVDVPDLFGPSSPSAALGDIDRLIWHQATVAAAAVALISPRVLLLGGGVIDMAHYPRQRLEQRIRRALPIIETVHPLDIRWTMLGWRAAIYGAMRLGASEDLQ